VAQLDCRVTMFYPPLFSYKPQKREIGKELLLEIKSAFESFDRGKKGYLDKTEFKAAVISLNGTKPTKVLFTTDSCWMTIYRAN
jgi:Ca2+-binding EF-hand superfamily protein